jgi:hypothetical protein
VENRKVKSVKKSAKKPVPPKTVAKSNAARLWADLRSKRADAQSAQKSSMKAKNAPMSAQAAKALLDQVRPFSAPKFHQQLLYHWQDFEEKDLRGWSDARSKLRQFSDTYGTYVVPGNELAVMATKIVSATNLGSYAFLEELLRRGLLRPIHY